MLKPSTSSCNSFPEHNLLSECAVHVFREADDISLFHRHYRLKIYRQQSNDLKLKPFWKRLNSVIKYPYDSWFTRLPYMLYFVWYLCVRCTSRLKHHQIRSSDVSSWLIMMYHWDSEMLCRLIINKTYRDYSAS